VVVEEMVDFPFHISKFSSTTTTTNILENDNLRQVKKGNRIKYLYCPADIAFAGLICIVGL